MRVLVTGATGFIGRSLVPQLVAGNDIRVTILVRETYGHADIRQLSPPLAELRDRIGVVYADLRNFQLTLRAVQEAEPEGVLHLAAAGVTDPFLGIDTALRHNLSGTINLLRACFEKTHNTRQCIVARTPGELSAMNVYAASKAAAWNFCQMYARTQQWPIQGAMIFQAYGPGQPEDTLIPSALKAALAGDDFPMTAGSQERDWIYVEDVASGLAAMLGRDLPAGTTVDLGTGRLTSIAEVVAQIYALAGRDGRPLVGALPDRPGEAARQVADAGRTESLIGWRAAVSLREGLGQVAGHDLS
ncbi:MAG TPA: GDP-mannose 4,6-dehydratase [Anaerolineae bacterium]